jgi:hypothetical protein
MSFRVRKVRVLAVAVPVAFAVVAGTALADPVLVESMGLDVWEIGRLERQLQAEDRVTQKLDADLQGVQDMAALNEAILDDVIAGRLELSAAAERKWELNRHRATTLNHLDRHYAGDSYPQKVAQDLVARAGRDDRGPGLRDRLAREYRAAYGVDLPKD